MSRVFYGFVVGMTAFLITILLWQTNMIGSPATNASKTDLESTLNDSAPNWMALNHIITYKHLSRNEIDAVLSMGAGEAASLYALSIAAKTMKDAMSDNEDLRGKYENYKEVSECSDIAYSHECMLSWLLRKESDVKI